MEKLFGLWQNISDSRTPHLFHIQWSLLQMEFLTVQVVLVFSLSFVNLPGVQSLFVLGLDAAVRAWTGLCASASGQTASCSSVALGQSWDSLVDTKCLWFWLTVLMLNCINGSVTAALTCIPQLSTACGEWQLQRAAAAVGSRRRDLVQEGPSDVGNYFVLSHQAYCYHGQTLLASDKCGEAIRSLQESEKCKCGWDWSTWSDDAMPILFWCIVLICSPIKILSVTWWKSSTPFHRDSVFFFFVLPKIVFHDSAAENFIFASQPGLKDWLWAACNIQCKNQWSGHLVFWSIW